MKKTTFSIMFLAFILGCSSVFADEAQITPTEPKKAPEIEQTLPPHKMHKPPIEDKYREQRKLEFEKKLKLTDEQKIKAKEIKEKGREEIKPVMKEIKLKRDEIKTIEQSFMTDVEKQKLTEPLRNDIKELNKKMHQMRVQNMKEFESILDKKQLKELEKMKQKGRKKFEKNMKRNRNEFKPPFLMVPPTEAPVIQKNEEKPPVEPVQK